MRQFISTTTLVEPVLAIVRAAGLSIMEIYTRLAEDGMSSMVVGTKEDDSPLTQADLIAHHIIAEGLTRLTPDIPVVSEEDADSLVHRQAQGIFWLIDPLDGTKEFLAHNDEFTVNIALIKDGTAVFGAVGAPALDLTYWGGIGIGVFRSCNGTIESIHVSQPDRQRPLRIVASKSHMNADTAAFIKKLGPHEFMQAGSSLKLCRVAEGAADCYPRLGPTCEWDTAAAQAIVESAGGHVYQLDGEPLRYGKADLLNPYFVASAEILI
ncbi:3'(2'),5'-bisphosphate nucleotidase [Sulfuriferula sp. AH1]|uniref:3'(2'),5'-bisphosphate nucleotidase CysQ n=1 Tax=Sulfuriferula sp. AH1 TaxID=1985873 RepID=UPI000B3B1981|nr:3'(2'),5'-bisphosphate nucleotidase CysQ [Sulfuriferula sp. AH1]ARU31002.1 3'(2'),5'-bisphosphate nucleotidase [Sulfuriferula sp. AH1]